LLIDDLQADGGGVSASIRFEESEGERRIWFRRERPATGYEGFVVACFLLAMQRGERRIAVDGPLDPAIAGSLATAAGYAAYWWGWKPPVVEARSWVATSGEGASASYFTGGADSLFTLHRNLRAFPEGHPLRVRRALLAYGFDSALGADNYLSGEERRSFDRLCGILADYLGGYGVGLEVVDTNVRADIDYGSFLSHLHGHFLAGMAHASGPGVYFLPSTLDVTELKPFGSHPDLDGNTYSTVTRVIHDGHDAARLRKLALMRDWRVDLSAIHVCWQTPREGPLNCGMCQKCRRTVFELLAVGADDLVATAFPTSDPREVRETIVPVSETDVALLTAAAALFREQGRPQTGVEEALRRRQAMQRRVEERDWRGPPKRLLRRLGLR